MLGNGKITDTVYRRSVEKILKDCTNTVFRDFGCLPPGEGTLCTAIAAESGNDSHMGACVVHQAVNRLTASGAEPVSVSLQMMVPAQLEEAEIKAMTVSAAAACRFLGITAGPWDVLGVSTLTEPVITAAALGRLYGSGNLQQGKPGQDVIMTGYAGWRGSVKLAESHREELEQHFNPTFLSALLDTDAEGTDFSCARAAAAAAQSGVTAMYAAGEGGAFVAAWELAARDGLGIRLNLKEIPLRQETVEICDYFGISPYQLLTEGSLLLAADHGQKVLMELAAAGIPAVIIGYLTDDNDRVVINDDEVRYLEPFRQDSLYFK